MGPFPVNLGVMLDRGNVEERNEKIKYTCSGKIYISIYILPIFKGAVCLNVEPCDGEN